ncbi:MAG: hypothetical protein KDC34_00130 [Saprospiraceae bacterium]|nr:hypothetical protein [Saprospiraceae bacterium]
MKNSKINFFQQATGIPFRGLLLVLFCTLSSLVKVSAQLSVSGSVETATAPFWDPINQNSERFLRNGYGLGANYHWRFGNNQAIALGPGIRYDHFKAGTLDVGPAELNISGILLNARLYPGHFLFSCDCDELKQRLFLEGNLGWHYAAMQVNSPDFQEIVQDKGMSIGFGFGMHLNAGPNFILSPIFRFCQLPNINWEGLDRFLPNGSSPYFRTNSEIRIFQIELQISFISLPKQ